MLHQLLDDAVRCRAEATAIVEGSTAKSLSYGDIGELTDRLRDRLLAMGIEPGDRVGIYLRKSADAVGAIFGILKAGAAYVPVDPAGPVTRNAYIHNNCAVKVVLVERRYLDAYFAEMTRLGAAPNLIVLEDVGAGDALRSALDQLNSETPAAAGRSVIPAPDDLSYILYTSGSTGTPKGVMLSHRNAIAFVDWGSEVCAPQSSDVFSSHAPFHFDLSIFDIFVAIKHGASLVLISDELGKEPEGLARLIARQRISVWYSAPATLSMLGQSGKIPSYDVSSLRLVLFAGEVMPIVHLRSFKKQVPRPRLLNLYGPTETNVCTWYEIPETIPEDRVEPYPIGRTCSQLESVVVDPDGQPVQPGGEGELCISGPNVMQGYWARPDLTARSFLPEDGSDRRWYRTGDIVVELDGGDYRFVGRRDRMVKKRGYRIELGEIEVCLYRHPLIQEAAVVAGLDESSEVRIVAHLSTSNGERPSLIALKTFCSKHLPLYMVPNVFVVHSMLPKTSTNKVDYQKLKQLT
jgi:amino acid adenylation domain-containing protein